MFISSISKINSSIYLSWAFQSNAGFHKSGLPCLGLCTPPTLGLLAPVASPVSSTFSAITMAMAARISSCVITVCIESKPVVSACILDISLPICLLSVSYTWHHIMVFAFDAIKLMYLNAMFYCMPLYKCVSTIQNYSMCYASFIYMVNTCQAWPLLIVTIAFIGQSLIKCTWYIHCAFSQTTMLIWPLHKKIPKQP